MKKLLVVGHTYIAPINQDKWIVFAELYPEVEVTVLFPHTWPDTMFTLKGMASQPRANCSFIPFKAFFIGNEVRYGYYPFALCKLLKKFQPDCIYVEQGDNAFSYFQIITLAKIFVPRARCAFFTWVNWEHQWSRKYRLLWSPIEKFNRYFSSGAVAGNHDAKELLLKKGFKREILVAPQLGVAVSDVVIKKQNTKKIFFVGRLTAEKGVFHLLHSFLNLSKDFPLYELHFVGSGPCESLLKEIAQKNQRVFFHGSVGHYQVFEYLSEAAIFVLPSYDIPTWREQFGHVLIEAMALKVPVIGTDGGEIAHVIGDAGLVARQNDVDSLEHCLRTLMADEKLQEKFGQMGYNRVQSNFSHQMIAQKTYEFLKQL
jgi:glycosyltransferase involved in cell wall biosynthesis